MPAESGFGSPKGRLDAPECGDEGGLQHLQIGNGRNWVALPIRVVADVVVGPHDGHGEAVRPACLAGASPAKDSGEGGDEGRRGACCHEARGVRGEGRAVEGEEAQADTSFELGKAAAAEHARQAGADVEDT